MKKIGEAYWKFLNWKPQNHLEMEFMLNSGEFFFENLQKGCKINIQDNL